MAASSVGGEVSDFSTLTIAADGSRPSRRYKPQKSRAFSATLLCAVSWWARLSHEKNLRPVFLDFCGTEAEHRAFVANLRCGRLAAVDGHDCIELLKSEPYRYAPTQRVELEAGPAIRQVVYLPDLFDVDVKTQSEEIWLCAMPPRQLLSSLRPDEREASRRALRIWNERIEAERAVILRENAVIEAERDAYYRATWQQRSDMPCRQMLTVPKPINLDDDALDYWALTSREVCVRLDARTRYPVPPEADFRVMLLHQLLQRGFATTPSNHPLRAISPERDMWSRRGVDVRGGECGYLAPMCVRLKQDELGQIVRELASAYYGVCEV